MHPKSRQLFLVRYFYDIRILDWEYRETFRVRILTHSSSCQVIWLLYSNHLNTGLVWYSNGRFVSICLMVVWNPDWKKPFMVRNVWCSVFRWLLYVKYGCTYLVNLTAMTPYLLRKWRAMSPILPPDTTTLAPESVMALICFSCKKKSKLHLN